MNNWDKTFAQITLLFSEHSKCIRKKVAAIAVIENRIISSGLNGTAPGTMNCCDFFKDKNLSKEELYDVHGKWSKENENHAEISLICFSNKNKISLEGSKIYLTLSPCQECAKALLFSGVTEVYYIEEYDRSKEGIEYLRKNNIYVEKILL